MIPPYVTQSLQAMQQGTASLQDESIVASWYATHQNELDTATSAQISSLLSKSRATTAGSQIGFGNQSTGSYVKPGTPAGLPSSTGTPAGPDWNNIGKMSSGMPATPANLEAAASLPSNYSMPAMDRGKAYNFGEEPTIGGLDIPVSQSQINQARQSWMNNPDTGGGAALLANPGLGSNYGNSQWENPDINAFYQNLTTGTPFEGMSPASIDMVVNDPSLYAKMLADNGGGGANTQAFLGPRANAALAMAGIGQLGNATRGMGTPGHNLESAPSSDVEKLLAAQAFMDQFNRPGAQTANVGALYQDAFDRANNTDFSTITDQNGNPVSPDDIIHITNAALMASAPFMSKETQTWLSSTLDSAALQYKSELVSGKTTMTYPAFLKSLGIDQMLSGV